MPRTKDFEPQEALDAAMDLFWRKGYEAVSMRELLDAMSIGRGSFYGTFGDKHALFLAALDRFREVRTSWIEEVLEESGLEAIEEVFRRSVDGLVESEVRRGCLLANSAIELAPHDPEVAGRIYRYVSRTEDAFEDALTRAKKAGEISADSDLKALARFLVNTLHGLRVLARAGSDREVLDDAVSVALGVLR
ncbi:MAG: TetR/AcrR family transcriptional regulator [Rubrobacteraceae bacterium]|nr:TetR/AcrR family transcriptional regulator [Rubrobacteraceae bacterium]